MAKPPTIRYFAPRLFSSRQSSSRSSTVGWRDSGPSSHGFLGPVIIHACLLVGFETIHTTGAPRWEMLFQAMAAALLLSLMRSGSRGGTRRCRADEFSTLMTGLGCMGTRLAERRKLQGA